MSVLRIVQNGAEKTVTFTGTPMLSEVLAQSGFSVAHPCGGRGVCRKCAVEVSGAVSEPNEAEKRAAKRLECQVRLLGDSTVVLPQTKDIAVEMQGADPAVAREGTAEGYGAALDVGTTTLALRLYALADGQCLGEAGMINPQTAVAADVMGRIQAAMEGGLARLQGQVNQAADRLLARAAQSAGIAPGQVDTLVVTGNTTMLYLFTGRDPRSLSRAPFEADCLFGRWENRAGRPMYLPRCMNAFVGADITCAVLSSGICKREETALLCDIGTNGEIALWHRGTLFITSTAIGPAFEGAGISCGMGGVAGAVDKVWAAQGRLDAHVIGGGKALGVCGSGLIDAVAAMRTLRWIDPNGTMDGEAVPLAEGISLTQQDIRQVQLAKAAVAAGIELLMDTAGVGASDIHALYIAGGFGSHLDPRSAAAIGLYPAALAPKVRVLGNAALEGAARLLDTERQSDTDAIVRAARPVQLSGNPQFADQFIRHMNF